MIQSFSQETQCFSQETQCFSQDAQKFSQKKNLKFANPEEEHVYWQVADGVP